MLERVETHLGDLHSYREWVDAETFRDLERLAARRRGLKPTAPGTPTIPMTK